MLIVLPDQPGSLPDRNLVCKETILPSGTIAPTKTQVLWIPGIGTSYDSRAPEPIQFVPGMNGPDRSWDQYWYQTKLISLKPETYPAHKL